MLGRDTAHFVIFNIVKMPGTKFIILKIFLHRYDDLVCDMSINSGESYFSLN